jgi:hypothetical protein
MGQSLVLDVKGLYTYSSEVSGVPSGSLSVAENVNISRLNIIEPRRGFELLSNGSLPLDTDRVKKLIFWNKQIFCHYGTTFSYYDGTGWLNRGTLSGPTNAQSIRYVSFQNKNLYVTSSQGLRKTDAIETALYEAGAPKGTTIDLALAGAGTAMTTGNYVTYRYLLARKDANSNFIFGGVSGRFTIQNASGSTQNITVTCFIPDGLNTDYLLQLYRSAEYTTDKTSDELQLVYETPLSSAQIAAKKVVITDITPESLLGTTIYTAPSQQGIVNSNEQPPVASDIAEFKNSLFFADIESRQRLTFTLLSAISTTFTTGSTIVVTLGASVETYTAGAAYNATTKTFKIQNAGASPSVNIDETIKSFIKLVNETSTLVYAYSKTESNTDLPGKVLLEARALGSDKFTVTSSAYNYFQPQLTSPATVNNTSDNDSFKNGLMFSKPYQPESVPLKNIFFVGASDDRIKRIVPLRDGLFIFKERDGVYVLRGENEATYTVSLLDGTAKLVAPDSVVSVNNQIYGLFESGICEISDTGVSIISVPIKDQLLPLYAAPLAKLKSLSFGIACETDGKYILSVPQIAVDTTTVKQFVFDVFGRTFCSWNLNLLTAAVNPANTKLYVAEDNKYVRLERKNYDNTDYADFGSLCTISAYSGATITISNFADMAVGDIIYQGSNALAYIDAIDNVNGTIVIDSPQVWTTGVNTVYHMKAIDVKVQWNADFAGNPAGLKHYYEMTLIQKQSFQKAAKIWFSSDVNPAENYIAIDSSYGNGAWGNFTWGDEIWGGEQVKSPRRIGIPRPQARCNQLTVRWEHCVAYSDFQLTGISFTYNPTSTRTSR